MRAVDLNADLGEGCGHDDELLAIVTSASVACGGHAGDAETMRRTTAAARARDVQIGAHVSYDDRDGFGRRETGASAVEIREVVARQLADFLDIASSVGAAVRYVKPHGALYHRVASDPFAADALAEAMDAVGLSPMVLLQAATPGAAALSERGVRVVAECFADRGYRPDGTLIDRTRPGAVIVDTAEAGRQAVTLAERAESICVHGDTPNSVVLARQVRAALEAAGVVVRAFS